MTKLIHILAASVGGGLVLGASIRLGEAIGSSAGRADKRRRKPVPPRSMARPDIALADRLDRLEQQVAAIQTTQAAPSAEWQAIFSDVAARMDRQQREVESVRRQVSNVTGGTDATEAIDAITDNLRNDLHRQLSEDLDRRLTDVEEKLHVSLQAANRETVSAVVASIETRVAPRISQLENDVIGQSAALSELRDCAHQSERSIQRLLMVLERVVNQKPESAGTGTGLAVVSNRSQDEPVAGSRRPASFR